MNPRRTFVPGAVPLVGAGVPAAVPTHAGRIDCGSLFADAPRSPVNGTTADGA